MTVEKAHALLDLNKSAKCKIIVALAEIGYENGHAGCVMAWQSARGGLGLPCAKGRAPATMQNRGLPRRLNLKPSQIPLAWISTERN